MRCFRTNLGTQTEYRCRLTPDHDPIRQTPYSVPLGIRELVKDKLCSLERQGIIERCDSCWSSPLVPVRKSDGGI